MIEIRQPQIQREKAVQAMQTFLETLGLDLKVLQMEKTPNRVTDAFINFFSGLWKNPDDEWAQPIQTEVDGLVAIRNIRFQSMCEHHLLPFLGQYILLIILIKERLLGLVILLVLWKH